MMKYKCYYVSGSGKEYDEGIFIVKKRTSKILTLEMIEEGFFACFPEIKIRKIPLEGAKRTIFCPAIEYFDDGSITVYHYRDGTPFIYEPIGEKQ